MFCRFEKHNNLSVDLVLCRQIDPDDQLSEELLIIDYHKRLLEQKKLKGFHPDQTFISKQFVELIEDRQVWLTGMLTAYQLINHSFGSNKQNRFVDLHTRLGDVITPFTKCFSCNNVNISGEAKATLRPCVCLAPGLLRTSSVPHLPPPDSYLWYNRLPPPPGVCSQFSSPDCTLRDFLLFELILAQNFVRRRREGSVWAAQAWRVNRLLWSHVAPAGSSLKPLKHFQSIFSEMFFQNTLIGPRVPSVEVIHLKAPPPQPPSVNGLNVSFKVCWLQAELPPVGGAGTAERKVCRGSQEVEMSFKALLWTGSGPFWCGGALRMSVETTTFS